MKFIIIVVIIIMFVYWRLSNATNTEQWHNIIASLQISIYTMLSNNYNYSKKT